MKHYILILALLLSSMGVMAQDAQRGERRGRLTEEQIAERQAKQAERVKKELKLADNQKEKFDAEYSNYMNIVMASFADRFKNRASRPTSTEEAVANINNTIDAQIVELAAKKQLINNLKDTLTAEQLMKLSQLVGGGGPMPNGNRRNSYDNRRNSRRSDQSTFGGADMSGGMGSDDDF